MSGLIALFLLLRLRNPWDWRTTPGDAHAYETDPIIVAVDTGYDYWLIPTISGQ
jgi:hypothetical protein